MSFLLDALDKADNDRNRSQVTELQTPVKRKSTLLRSILKIQLILFLMILSFVLGYVLRPYIEGGSATDGVGQASIEKSAAESDANNPVQVSHPQAAQQAADIKLSAISYSNVPATRFAMINGFAMYEGDELASGERIQEIQRDAVVLAKNGTQIHLALTGSSQ